MGQFLLSLESASSSLVISLKLRTPFIFITMKVRKSPKGFLGGLPGPDVWKHSRKTVWAKLKSMFLKRVSRVSCSSCPAWAHLLSLNATHLIRDPSSQNKLFNLGTSQRTSLRIKIRQTCLLLSTRLTS